MREAMWDMYDADTGAALDNSKAISLNVDAENTDEVDLALFVDDDDHPESDATSEGFILSDFIANRRRRVNATELNAAPVARDAPHPTES